MMNQKINSDKRNDGFTLVELIVTMVIMAVLAAIIIPVSLSYIDKAKEEKYILEARRVSDGVQYYVLEEYAAGRLSNQTVKDLIMYPLGNENHPLSELLSGSYTEGAFISSVSIGVRNGKYLRLVYEVDGYTIEYNLEKGTIAIKD